MPPHEPRLPPAVTELLERLRRRIRRYVWWEGLTTALAWLGVAFWITLGIDWFFEPPGAVRAAILVAVGLGLGWILVERVVRRVLARLTDDNMALLLERYFPEFEESLLTAVELTARGAAPSECNPDMLARACRQAAEPVAQVRLQRVFNPVPLRRSVSAAVLLACGIALYAAEAPEGMAVWARRQLLLDDVLWPRSTRLEVEGFSEANDFTVKAAKGTDLELIAKADLRWPVVPQTVQVRYRTQSGSRDRRTMSREGTADPDQDAFQQYSYTFRGVASSIEFDVVGGDAAVRGLRIEVVDSPAIVGMQLDCRYPDYMARQPQTLPVSATVMAIPAGTRVTVRAKTNKDLVRVEVQRPAPGSSGELASAALALTAPRAFQYEVEKLADDTTLLLTLHDADGIKSREPIRLTLARLDDKAPELAVQLRGIGPAITPRAMLPATGKATDDYGIARLWFEYAIDQGRPSREAIPVRAANPTELPIKQTLDVRPLNLTPGQKLLVTLKAADHCNLAPEPNVGSSQRWLLDVVAPEHLRAMLEARELALRQRFAAIIEEVQETRDSMGRVEFSPPPSGASRMGGDPLPLGEGRREGELTAPARGRQVNPPSPPAPLPASGATGASPKGAEPGDKPESHQQPSAQRLAELRLTRVQRALQYSHKNASETLGVADAFSDIREELINNRIDSEELNRRLKEGIADPLRDIAQRMFPDLDRLLEQLLKDIDDARAGPAGRDQAIRQIDAILAAMRQVLDRMVELEDFNEAIERLRSIIQEQEKLGDLIKQRHKQKLRDLMEK